MKKAFFNWSGGKDSAFALWQVQQQKEYSVDCLLSNFNQAYDRLSMHGVRRELIAAQAASIGIPLTTIELPEQPGMEEYESAMLTKVQSLKEQGYDYSIFGDIFLEDLRQYREEKLHTAGIGCVFPIWKRDTQTLLRHFMEAGFKTIVVCVNDQYLDASFCGRIIDEQFLKDLPPHVDPCGENGEFHSFCFEGPVFKSPVAFSKGEMVYKEYKGPGNEKAGFYFTDLIPR